MAKASLFLFSKEKKGNIYTMVVMVLNQEGDNGENCYGSDDDASASEY